MTLHVSVDRRRSIVTSPENSHNRIWPDLPPIASVDPGEELELHLNLQRHGRRTCYARRPDCDGCALKRICPSAGKV